ncbi:MAG: DUF2141 domain-containing protein [Crocinitomicaceae bacterium]|nr:DUF2141 domain-containing protein [Crocinitomicaceae bacterium]
MKKIGFVLLTLVALFGISATTSSSSNHSISLDLYNIRNTKGNMYIYLYNYSNQYPYHPYKHFKISKQNVKDGHLRYTISSLKKGQYVITAIDDENANNNLDRVLGIPKEGYAFSNNVKGFILPAYHRLQFQLSESKKHLSLKVQYVK